MNFFDKIPLTHFKPLIHRDGPHWKNYEQINGFVNINLEEKYRDVLAKPFLSGDAINWYSPKVGDYKPLDSLSLSQRQTILLNYHLLLRHIAEKKEILNNSGTPDNRIWANQLELVFDTNNNIIYSNGKEFILLWGFQFNNRDENFIEEEVLNNYLNSLSTSDIPDEVPVNENPIISHDKIEVPKPSFENHEITQKNIIVRSNKVQDKSNSFWYNYWWLILLLVFLIFLISPRMNSCHFNPSLTKQQELERIIPADPLKRLPIDTSKLIKGDSGISRILSNIFNIALKDKSKDFSSFAIALKKAFPDSSYQIVFFDTSVSRLQFQFPDSNRNQLKDDIRKKLSDYSLLIWDESVFSGSKKFNDPIFNNASESWYLTAIGAPEAWDITSGKKEIVISVIDDGFDINNPDLAGKLIKPYNIPKRNSSISANEERFHGTHVAGLALGNSNNAFGISGIAPDCSFLPVQIADANSNLFTFSDVIDGMLYAIRNGADVINMSLGKYFSEEVTNFPITQQKSLIENTGKDEESFWNELFDYAEKEKTIIVIASGNQHVLAGLDPMLRSEKIIIVGAINAKLEPASFSNFGNKVTIYAPGENIYSLVPGNKTKFLDGTSMASPLVAGTIALMKCRNKNLTVTDVIRLIKNNSESKIYLNENIRLLKANKLLSAVN